MVAQHHLRETVQQRLGRGTQSKCQLWVDEACNVVCIPWLRGRYTWYGDMYVIRIQPLLHTHVTKPLPRIVVSSYSTSSHCTRTAAGHVCIEQQVMKQGTRSLTAAFLPFGLAVMQVHRLLGQQTLQVGNPVTSTEACMISRQKISCSH
jgi:hypothetical protein